MSMARSIIFVVALFCGITSMAQAQSEKPLPATSSTVMPVIFQHGDVFPMWTGGALLVVQDRFSASPTVKVIDKNGDVASRFTFAVPGISWGMIFDHCVARGSDGSIVMAGSAAAATDSRWTSYLAMSAPDGTNKAVVRLFPFWPEAATIAADGTIWVAGAVHPEPGYKADTDQYLIRRYSPQGELLSSRFKWSDMTTRDHGFSPAQGSVLMPSKDRVGWYSPSAHSYMEFSLDGKIMTQIKSWTRSAEHDGEWPVLCEDGSVFVGDQVFGTATAGPKYGVFVLNRDTGTWNFTPRKQYTYLLGCDGTSVPAFSGEFTKVTWFEARRP
jgi:hypothetical protein